MSVVGLHGGGSAGPKREGVKSVVDMLIPSRQSSDWDDAGAGKSCKIVPVKDVTKDSKKRPFSHLGVAQEVHICKRKEGKKLKSGGGRQKGGIFCRPLTQQWGLGRLRASAREGV